MNRYSKCVLCEEIVYLYKKYTNKPSDKFFDNYRAVVKNDYIFCVLCYRHIYYKRHYI